LCKASLSTFLPDELYHIHISSLIQKKGGGVRGRQPATLTSAAGQPSAQHLTATATRGPCKPQNTRSKGLSYVPGASWKPPGAPGRPTDSSGGPPGRIWGPRASFGARGEGYSSCGCNLKLSEVRSGSFRAPASVTILSQASSNPERSRVARHGRGHIWPGGGMAIPSGD
jgi:hypothetical protein